MNDELPNTCVVTVDEVMKKASDANQDLWDNAVLAISGIRLARCENGLMTPVMDAKPLVDLLCSDALMPASARYAIAEFLDPGEHTSTNMKLVPTRIDTLLKESEFFNRHIPAVLEYDRLRAADVSGNDALEKAGAANAAIGKFGYSCDPSNFHKTRKKVRAYLAWIRGT